MAGIIGIEKIFLPIMPTTTMTLEHGCALCATKTITINLWYYLLERDIFLMSLQQDDHRSISAECGI